MTDELSMTGRPSVIEYETKSGVRVHVTPLSPFTVRAISTHAEETLPYPDPAPYELPIENAVDESVRMPASDNPAYRALCAPIDSERTALRVTTCIDLACTYPAFADRDHMLAHFRPMLEKLRPVARLPEDEWQAVLLCCVFTGTKDRQTVLDLALQSTAIPLTGGEVLDGTRWFRIRDQG